MIDINKLRQAPGVVQPEEVEELLDRLEAAEKAVTETYRRGYATGQEEIAAELEFAKREVANLHDDISEWMDKCDVLRARITKMEKQEPVKHEFQGRDGVWYPFIDQRHHENTVADGSWPVRALYTLPGAQAQPAPSEPSDEYVGWYCAHCERGVDASEVTYHEQHQACGRVITDDRPPKASVSAPEGWKLVPIEVVGLYNFMCAAFVPMTPQQEQIAVQLELAKHAMLAAATEAKP